MRTRRGRRRASRGGRDGRAVTVGRRVRPTSAGRLEPGLERRLRRPGRRAPLVRELDRRHRPRLPGRPRQLGHRRDPAVHRRPRQPRPGRRRQPADHPGQVFLGGVDVGPDRDPAHQLQARRRPRPAHRGTHPDAQRHRQPGPRLLAAFWALGSPYRGNYQNWPAIGEFDIMENVNGLNSVWGVLHCGTNPGGACNETNGIGANRACPGSSCQSAMHTYRFEWDRSVSPNQLRWYVDGQQFHSISQSQLDATTWANMTGHAGYFLLLNVAMGGGFPDGVAGHATPTGDTVSGRPMLVDYVAVWQSGGGSTPPPGDHVDARSTIQAESRQAESGTQNETTTDSGGGQNVGFLSNGDWLRYDNVDFGGTPATQFKARVASGAPAGVSGLVQVRLGSPTGQVLGSFAVANTGGWQSWRTVPANISGVTGRHTVYITFSSGQPADFVNLNWFTFSS
ncbi:carbohydrate-binding protein [Actinomadura madurae]|nr:carbohydrate-binding protein [Actinomadura madurae]MCP9948366.1 carbohydrate-binding protein [Actinomadura madurae]